MEKISNSLEKVVCSFMIDYLALYETYLPLILCPWKLFVPQLSNFFVIMYKKKTLD